MMPSMTEGSQLELIESSLAYDRYASRYDAVLIENKINAYMRSQMIDEERRTFSPGDNLLEIGCGTGDEALELAKRGCRVIAVDPSEGMLNQARSKANRVPFGVRVRFLKGYAREIGALVSGIATLPFDGAYSSFALSYETNLELVSEALARYIKPGGFFLAALMNRVCAAEGLLAIGTLHPSIAGRRLAPITRHKVGQVDTSIIARTVHEVNRVFNPFFKLVDLRGLPVVLPPAYLNRLTRRFPGVMELAEQIDAKTARLPILRGLGDHTLFKFRRRHAA